MPVHRLTAMRSVKQPLTTRRRSGQSNPRSLQESDPDLPCHNSNLHCRGSFLEATPWSIVQSQAPFSRLVAPLEPAQADQTRANWLLRSAMLHFRKKRASVSGKSPARVQNAAREGNRNDQPGNAIFLCKLSTRFCTWIASQRAQIGTKGR